MWIFFLGGGGWKFIENEKKKEIHCRVIDTYKIKKIIGYVWAENCEWAYVLAGRVEGYRTETITMWFTQITTETRMGLYEQNEILYA